MTEQEIQNLLSRLEERSNFNTKLHEANSELIKQVAVQLKEYVKAAEEKYVTKDEFNPVRQIVYGLVGLILVSVVGAVIALVVRV